MKRGSEKQTTSDRYFGSIRFFKNLILLAVLLLIAIPTIAAVQQNIRGNHLTNEVIEYQEKYDAATKEIRDLESAVESMRTEQTEYSSEPNAELIEYQELYPDFYAPDPKPEMSSQEKTMYLTFDDGPSASTPEILSVLKEKNVRATFFVVTQGGETDISLMKQMVAEGHTLAMHSYTHDCDKIYESVESFLEDYYQLFHLIQDEVGITPTIFRFPGGSLNSYNQETYQEIIAEMLRRGFVFYDWNLAACDAVPVPPDKEEIVSNILEPAVDKKRGFVLMHDLAANHSTVEALPEIIDGLRGQGFVLAPLNRSVRPVYFYYS